MVRMIHTLQRDAHAVPYGVSIAGLTLLWALIYPSLAQERERRNDSSSSGGDDVDGGSSGGGGGGVSARS